MSVLRALFDIGQFKPDEVRIQIEGKVFEDRANAVFRKTMLRRAELPENVDTKSMSRNLF